MFSPAFFYPSLTPSVAYGDSSLKREPFGPVDRLRWKESTLPPSRGRCRGLPRRKEFFLSVVSPTFLPFSAHSFTCPRRVFLAFPQTAKNRRIPGPPVFVSFRGGDRRSFLFLLSSFFFIRFSADFKDGKFSPAGSAAERRRKRLCSLFSGQIFPLHYI